MKSISVGKNGLLDYWMDGLMGRIHKIHDPIIQKSNYPPAIKKPARGGLWGISNLRFENRRSGALREFAGARVNADLLAGLDEQRRLHRDAGRSEELRVRPGGPP